MSAPAEASPSTAPRRSRLRRLLRWGLIALLLVAAGRVALSLALPTVARRIAAAWELELNWAELNLALLEGRVEIWDFSLGAPGAEPFLTFDFLHADLDVGALFAGDVSLRRVEVDGLVLLVERAEDGSLTLASQLAPLIEALSGSPDAEAEPEDTAIELGLPLRIGALRAHDARIHYRDATLEPPLEVLLNGVMRASSLGSREDRAKLEFLATSPGYLDLVRVEGTGSSGGQDLDLDLAVGVAGMHPRPLAPLLALIGIDPRADGIDLALDVKLTARACAGRDDACRVEFAVTDAAILADGERSLALDSLKVSAAAISAQRLDGARIEVDGAHVLARRLPAGELYLAGLALGGGEESGADDASADSASADSADADDPSPSDMVLPTYQGPDVTGASWPVLLEAAELRGASLRFIDEAVPGGAELALEVDELSLGELAWDPVRTGESTPLRGRLRAPGLAGSIDLDGEVVVFSREQRLNLELNIDELRPEAAQPYLTEAGIESDFERGGLSCRLTADVEPLNAERSTLTLALEKLELVEGDATLFELDRLALVGLQRDLSRSFLRAEELVIEGAAGGVRWDQPGNLHALGLSTVLATEEVAQTQPRGAHLLDAVVVLTEAFVPEVETFEALLSMLLPGEDARVELGSFAWNNSRLTFVDEGFTPARVLEVTDMGAGIDDLVLGHLSEEDPAPPASVRLWLGIEDVIERLSLEGRVLSHPGPINADVALHLSMQGITGAWLEPYLEGTGIEPLYQGASFDLDLTGQAAAVEGGVDAQAGLSDLSLLVGGERVLGLDALSVKDARVRTDRVQIASVEIAGSYLRTGRDALGALEIAGLRIHPLPADEEQPTLESPTPVVGSPPEPAPEEPSSGKPIDFQLERLSLTAAALEWSDAMASPPVETRLGFTGELNGFQVLENVASLHYDGALDISGALEELRLHGDISLGRANLTIDGDLEGRGLSTAGLRGYVPPGQRFELEDARFGLSYRAELARVDPEVPERLRLELTGEKMYLRDGPEGEDVLALDSAVARADLLDFVDGEFAFDELSVRGLRAEVVRTPDGALHALGFELRTDVEAAAPPAPPLVEDAGSLRRAFRARPPRISIETLDLELAELSLHDQSIEGSAPLELGLRLTSPGPLVLLDRDPVALPAMDLVLEGFARPPIQHFEIQGQIEPYATSPTGRASAEFSGLYAAGISQLIPAMGERLSGEGMQAGVLGFDLAGQLLLDRRNPLEFDPSRDFGLLLEVLDVELRESPEADPLMALDALYLDAQRISPTTGEVHVRTLALSQPYFRATLREDELQIGGLIIALPELARARQAAEAAREQAIGDLNLESEPAEVAAGAAEQAATEVLASAPEVVAQEPGPELRLDNLILSEIDFYVVDESAEPALHIPLEDLYLEVEGLSSLALSEPRVVQFNGFVNAGEVELPGRRGAPPERRPFFFEVTGSGRVQAYPQLEGWAKFSVSGLELLNLRGRAEQAGVIISSGVMDNSLRLRFKGDDGVHVDSSTVFTDLSVTEAENGPIRSTLKLPAPLNTVILVLESPGGELRVPLNFNVNAQGVSAQDIFLAGSAAFATMVTTAIATSPLRLGGAVTGMLGLSGGDSGPKPARVESFHFSAGDTSMGPEVRALLAELQAELVKDKRLVLRVEHALGGLDLARAELMSNPTREESVQLVARLRQRRSELIRMRDELAARARTWLLVGQKESEEPSRVEFRELHLELSRVEQALDQVCELLRPDADRRRFQRTRKSCAQLGRLRLHAVQLALSAGLTPDQAGRVELRQARFRQPEGDLVETGGLLTITLVERR